MDINRAIGQLAIRTTTTDARPGPSQVADSESAFSRPESSHHPPPPTLQARLWTSAYQKLKLQDEGFKVLSDYEAILAREIPRSQGDGGWEQMEELIRSGLEKTGKAAKRNAKIKQGIDIFSSVKDIVDKAIQASPEGAVAWTAICLGMQILSNPITETIANREGMEYVLSRIDWYWRLADSCFLSRPDEAEKSMNMLLDQLEDNFVGLYQRLLLYQIKSICLYYVKCRKRVWRSLFNLDDWSGQIDDIKDAEKVFDSDLKQYRGERDLLENHKIHGELQAQTMKQSQAEQSQEDKKCLNGFYETDPNDDKTRIQESKDHLLEDSYRWILEHPDFLSWRDNSENRLLWIHGDPGKGKTMLLCGLIDEYRKGQLQTQGNQGCLAFFFCQATDPRLSNATAVIRGLIYSLVTQSPGLLRHVRKEYDVGGKDRFNDSNAWQVMKRIFTAILADEGLEEVTLIIDALDECQTDRGELLDFIATLCNTTHAKWIVSSRNWILSEGQLNQAQQKCMFSLSLNEDAISTAVSIYIRHRVRKLGKDKGYDKKTQNLVEAHLMSNANSTFLWVALVFKQLSDPAVRKRHTLKKLQSFPPGLEPFYQEMMKQMKGSEDADICRQILARVALAYRPLTLDELGLLVEPLEEFSGDIDTIKEIVYSCGSLLTIREGIVYVVHQSVKDFLLGSAVNQILPSGIQHGHYDFFSRSLDIILRGTEDMAEDENHTFWILRRNPYQLHEPGTLIEEVCPPDPDPLQPIRYSCIYWVDHLEDSYSKMVNDVMTPASCCKIIERFFEEKYLYWLEALSLLRLIHEAVLAVRKIERIVTETDCQTVIKLARDASRFILQSKNMIETAPLQTYISALVFTPMESCVRHNYADDFPKWICSIQGMRKSWSPCLQAFEAPDKVDLVGCAASMIVTRSKGAVDVWHSESGAHFQRILTEKGDDNDKPLIAFSTDGQWLATTTAHSNCGIKVWNPLTGECSDSFEESVKDGRKLAMVFLTNNSLVLLYENGRVKACHPSRSLSLSLKCRINKGTSCLGQTTLSSDGRFIAASISTVPRERASETWIEIWDQNTGALLHCLEREEGLIECLTFSPDGRHLASFITSSSDECPSTVKLWNTEKEACIRTHDLPGPFSSMAFSQDGKLLAVVGLAGSITWSVITGTEVAMWVSNADEITFSHDNHRVVTVVRKQVRVWDISTTKSAQSEGQNSRYAASLRISEDGSVLLIDRGFHHEVWDTEDGNRLSSISNDVPESAWLSPDGKKLALFYNGKKCIRILDPITGECLWNLDTDFELVRSTSFSADGRLFASMCKSNMFDENSLKVLKVWDLSTGECIRALDMSYEGEIALSDCGQFVALAEFEGNTIIWNLANGTCTRNSILHASRGTGDHSAPSRAIRSIALSVEARRLAVGYYDDLIEVWDLLAENTPLKVGQTNSRCLNFVSFKAFDVSTLRTDGEMFHFPIGCGIDTEPKLRGYNLLSDMWVRIGERKLFLIPSEYRPSGVAIAGPVIVLSRDGEVLIIRLSEDG